MTIAIQSITPATIPALHGGVFGQRFRLKRNDTMKVDQDHQGTVGMEADQLDMPDRPSTARQGIGEGHLIIELGQQPHCSMHDASTSAAPAKAWRWPAVRRRTMA